VSSLQGQVSSLQGQVSSLQNQVASQGQTISQDNATITSLQGQLAQARAQAAPAPAPTTGTAPAPAAPAAPSFTGTAPGAPAPSVPGPLAQVGDAFVNSCTPNAVRPGQQVLISVTQGHAPVLLGVQVLFSGVPGTLVNAGFGPGKIGRIYAVVPNLPPGIYRVQFTAGNYVSSSVAVAVK
jgi:hypothetical protein